MEGKELRVPEYFLRIMVPGFQQKLNLPPIFSKELRDLISRRAILESRIGTWRVSLCRNRENGLICLKQGWPQFVERHALTMGEFVFFEHTGDLHFNVSVFKTNNCEKEFLDEEKKQEEGTETLIPTQKSTIEEEEAGDESMFFEKTMIPVHATKVAMVNIPIEFMRSNSLGLQHTSVVLRDPSGREWLVKLSHGDRERVRRFRMRRGWHDFYASNGLKDGDNCVFTLNRRLLTSTIITFNVNIIRAK